MAHPAADTDRPTTLRTPLGRVRGSGSAKSGTHHWWMQRVTSMALLPLTLWFIVVLATSAGMTQVEAALWIGQPFNAVLLLALIGLTFHHTASGLQVVIEDYAKPEWVKIAAVLAVKAVCALLALAAALAVLRLAV
ncbi:succinate dehydrogenase, hydrophobic membrane anchor protein [Falsiroseomonas selenitidurans]|uniref:Succinate dehydrogenase hydrophobic membrane anchor subunit n=1 Tax=Falsiroseomonas selenitidurans TaxID=2716335 RepID=A0ABX1E6L2_9PROT|nr:succinate dehydrogenase, hydrophobic membrane anchor protein [Falsiroseomonas selenitidurans]NKC32598.1 succinate dehydrogenase, hydrophobic membrane anchor protein [Falsiroseomonas selenitidurans]